MSYVSSNNIGDLDWTIFDTYYQGFWYLNLNPFKVGLGRVESTLEVAENVYFCAFSLSHRHNFNEIVKRKLELLELVPTFALSDDTPPPFKLKLKLIFAIMALSN